MPAFDLKRTLTGTILAMNINGLSFAAIAVAGLLCSCTTNRNQTGSKTKTVELPESCTLASMSAAERQIHKARLELLRRAASNPRLQENGFSFVVKLTELPQRELEEWAKNEQGCCSFLRIAHEIDQSGNFAEVTVDCPPEDREDMMRAFGLLH